MSGALRTVAELMAIAARTAPKSAGKDFVVVEIVEGETLQTLADRMEEFGFDRSVSADVAILQRGLPAADRVSALKVYGWALSSSCWAGVEGRVWAARQSSVKPVNSAANLS